MVEREIDTAGTGVVSRSHKTTTRDLFDKYAKEVSPTKKGAKWEVVRLKKIARAAWAAKRVNEVTKKDINDWKAEQSVSAASVRREMNLVSAVFNYAIREWSLPIKNPLQGVSRPADSRARERRPSTAELGAIRSHFAEKKMGLLVELAIETAMRLSELCSIEWADVNLDGQYITLSDTKNGTKRNVPLSTRAVELLRPHVSKGPVIGITAGSAGVFWREAMKVLKIEDLHFHDLRHEATTRLSTKLVNVLELAAVTGHKSLKHLQRYYNPDPTDLAKKLG